jgi:MYXO-CTERM domain-containing protein
MSKPERLIAFDQHQKLGAFGVERVHEERSETMIGLTKMAGIVVALTVTMGSLAQGSVITLSGSTSGSFSPSATEWTFTPQTDFTWTTDSAGNATVNLGTLSWGTSGLWTVLDAFTLTVAFTSPGTTPVSKVSTADFWSRNVFYAYGSAEIFFNDVTTTHFTCTNAQGTWSFDLTLNGTDTTAAALIGQDGVPHKWYQIPSFYGSVQITGQISNATFTPAPDPATMALLALGGLAMLRRRRK